MISHECRRGPWHPLIDLPGIGSLTPATGPGYGGRMPHTFEPSVIEAVLRHMNSDHTDDNVLIARAFGPYENVIGATMIGFDGDGADWVVYEHDGTAQPLRVAWPSGPISERPAVRREVVALYDQACARLGVEPRPHA